MASTVSYICALLLVYTGASSADFCSTNIVSVGKDDLIYLPSSGGHGCKCEVATKGSEPQVVSVAVHDLTGDEVVGKCQAFITTTVNDGVYTSCAQTTPMSHHLNLYLKPGDKISLTLVNVEDTRALNGRLKLDPQAGRGNLSVTCMQTTDLAQELSHCPCDRATNGSIYSPPGMLADNTSLNTRLTIGFCLAAAFLVIIAVVLIGWWYWKRRNEDVEAPPEKPVGATNRAYHESKTSLGKESQKPAFTPDPEINMNMRQTPSQSTDSGIHGIRPNGNNLNPDPYYDNTRNIHQHPSPQGPKYAPEEIEGMYAKPHKRSESPPPNMHPRTRLSREQLNNDYVTAELYAPSEGESAHNASHNSLETAI